MQSSLEETFAEMDELENQDSELDTNSNADSKCSSRNYEVDESDRVTSEYAALYKVTKLPESQEKRRKKLLEELKERRNQDVNKKRGLAELLTDDNSDEDHLEVVSNEFQEEPMDVTRKPRRRRRKRRKNLYKNQLMRSEWFTEIPADLESQWLVKLCPMGSRNLVVANNGFTKAYNQYGGLISTFQSALPGGFQYHFNHTVFTILDCIYSKKLRCYYVLDVLAWNSCGLKYSDAELRFFWIKSKLEESPETKEVNALNEYPFYEICSIPAELPLIQDKLSRPYQINDQIVALDGILFYHRATHYISSETPLVGWLKPVMVPEMLNVPVDESLMTKKPRNYKSMEQYLQIGAKNKQQGKHNNELEMET